MSFPAEELAGRGKNIMTYSMGDLASEENNVYIYQFSGRIKDAGEQWVPFPLIPAFKETS